VDPGKHRLLVEKEGFRVYTKELTIDSGGTTELAARLEPLPPSPTFAVQPERGPPAAIAPFTAEEARRHQERWAQHLGVPIEFQNSIGMRLRLIPPGEFTMGSTGEQIASLRDIAQQEGRLDFAEEQKIASEGPAHRIRITQPFCVAAHEVTVGQFKAFVQATGYRTAGEADGIGGAGLLPHGFETRPEFTWRNTGFQQTDEHPVTMVNWNDAVAFCRWLSATDGLPCRLPTEAEWEYVCRSGTTTGWHFGDDADDANKYAWHSCSGGPHTKPVGQKLPNAFGIFDMCGNAREWCSDWYAPDYYSSSPAADPGGPPAGTERVARGASFFDLACFSCSACRYHREPIFRVATDGFRPVFVLERNNDLPMLKSRPPVSGSSPTEPRLADREDSVDTAALLRGHTGGIRAVAFSADGQRVLSASADGTARLWDAVTGEQLAILQGHRRVVTDVRFLPGDDRAVTSSDDAAIHLWNLTTREVIRSFHGHTGDVIAIDLSADGRRMVSCGHDPRLRLWDVETGQQIKDFEQSGYSGSWYDIALLPDGRSVLASPGHGTYVVQWDLATGELMRMRDIKGPWAQIDVSSDGRGFLFGHTTNIGLWNLETDKLEWSQPTRSGFSVPVRFLPDGKRLLAVTDDGSLDLMESRLGNRIRRFRGGTALAFPGLGVSPDGRLAASEGPQHSVILWRVPPPADAAVDPSPKGTP
jgi:formylglycine-generating enzyme required for sulfatase activity